MKLFLATLASASAFEVGGRTYSVHTQAGKNWFGAKNHCADQGMQLVEFESEQMYNDVWANLEDSTTNAYWVGYKELKETAISQSGTVDDPFTSWWSSEPNDNPNIGREDCVRMRKKDGEDGTMNDALCNLTWAGPESDNIPMSYICQSKPTYPDSPLCPSTYNGNSNSGCYVQNQPWSVGADITCTMRNSACLDVQCNPAGLNARLRKELFHINLEDERPFVEQLHNGDRAIMFGNTELQEGTDCGYSIDGDFVVINWNYSTCDVEPSMSHSLYCPGEANSQNAILYEIRVVSPGNAGDEDETIEFYVDTDVAASCQYCTKFVVDAKGFYVNQEDVSAAKEAIGDWSEDFSCKLFSDSEYNNQLTDSSIINMGQNIYGLVESQTTLPGVKYNLVDFIVSDGNDNADPDHVFKVIDNGVTSQLVSASSADSASTGSSLAFTYLSFGFENLDNQNDLDNKCVITLSLE